MFVDAKLQLSDDQALTATAASTNVIDLGIDRDIGRGEPMCAVITVTTAADTANADETYSFALETDDNDSFSSATVLATYAPAAATLAAGYQFIIPLAHENERYLRLNYTLGGTTPSVTVSAYLSPQNFVDSGSGKVYYDGGYTVS